MNTIIEAKGLSFGFTKNHPLFDKLNFNIQENDFVILTGPNGTGKTTLFFLLMGFLNPCGGSINIMEQSPRMALPYIGYIPQKESFKSLSIKVVDVIISSFITRKTFFYVSKEYKEKAYDVLEKIGLKDLANKNFDTLSGGQVQKVLLARLMVNPKKILLLDEAFANVDMESKEFIYEYLTEINKTTTMIMISHDISLFSKHKGKMMLLNQGNIYCYNNVQEMEQAFFHTLH